MSDKSHPSVTGMTMEHGDQLLRLLDRLDKAGPVLTDYSLVHTMRVPAA